jgi:hypothetical protein
MVTRLMGAVLLFLIPAASLAAPDCDSVLTRCRETPRRCSATKLK